MSPLTSVKYLLCLPNNAVKKRMSAVSLSDLDAP